MPAPARAPAQPGRRCLELRSVAAPRAASHSQAAGSSLAAHGCCCCPRTSAVAGIDAQVSRAFLCASLRRRRQHASRTMARVLCPDRQSGNCVGMEEDAARGAGKGAPSESSAASRPPGVLRRSLGHNRKGKHSRHFARLDQRALALDVSIL
jgi:hypothetical protein